MTLARLMLFAGSRPADCERLPDAYEPCRGLYKATQRWQRSRFEQGGNENIVNVKIVSSNQLKSGDLSIKTASSSEVEALRQFADDWAHRIGSGTTVQILTFGVLVHGIRTSTMDMSKLDEIKAQILQDNRPYIPQAEIRHIGWLTRDAAAKTATTITIEFTKLEDANKIIDEGLVWQGEVF
jgi:hypothetical protein